MKRVRFIAAFPTGQRATLNAVPVRVAAKRDVLAEVPKIWIGEGLEPIPCGDCGFVLGHLFSRETWRPVGDADELHRFSGQSLPEVLVGNFWGAYCAFSFDAAQADWTVVPDPSGLLPVYRRRTASHVLLSTDPALFALPGSEKPQIDWESLTCFLERPELRERRTCLAGIDELRPGSLYRIAEGAPPGIPVWWAGTFMPPGGSADFDAAAVKLRQCMIGVMDAWVYTSPLPAVAVSGGVDSSVICAALAAGGHEFGCVTIATSDSSGDERLYARELAAHFGAKLVERVYDPAAFDPHRSASFGQARPNRRSFSTAVDALLADGAKILGTDLVLDGNGGDNLFCYLHSAAPVVDRLRNDFGLRGIFGTLIDMCRVTGCDLPTMIRASLKRLAGAGSVDWPADRRFLVDGDLKCCTADPLSPWLDESVGSHPGKKDHLAFIMHAQNHIHGLGPGPDRFSPLMSQPLMELCLGIPTWIWPQGGRNRALARAAFALDLPDTILRRTSKAGPDSFVRRTFAQHREAIRELILDGLLASHRVIDRETVERAMGVESSSLGSITYRLLDLAEAENWARSWA